MMKQMSSLCKLYRRPSHVVLHAAARLQAVDRGQQVSREHADALNSGMNVGDVAEVFNPAERKAIFVNIGIIGFFIRHMPPP